MRLPANPNPPPSSRPDVLLADHGNTVEREYFVLFENLGLALVPGAFAGVMYIALEPYVRWRWPQLLIGWIQVLTGHLRDPLVGIEYAARQQTIKQLRARHRQIETRIDIMYTDNLDGRITQELFDRRSADCRREQQGILGKIQYRTQGAGSCKWLSKKPTGKKGSCRRLCSNCLKFYATRTAKALEKEKRTLGLVAIQRFGSPETVVCTRILPYNPLNRASTGQLMASLTGLPTRLSISTSVSIVNLAVFLFTTSDTRGRETIRILAASACFK